MQKVNIKHKMNLFNEYWSPKIVGDLNDSHVKLAKFQGEFLIIPKGIEHLPIANEEVHVMLIEPKTTLNTGDAKSNLTKNELDRL